MLADQLDDDEQQQQDSELAQDVLEVLGTMQLDEETAEELPTSWTAAAIATELSLPLRDIRATLRLLADTGRVTSRLHRSGRRLYSLTGAERAAQQEIR